MMRSPLPQIGDVAHRAGVAVSTVSKEQGCSRIAFVGQTAGHPDLFRRLTGPRQPAEARRHLGSPGAAAFDLLWGQIKPSAQADARHWACRHPTAAREPGLEHPERSAAPTAGES
jgi:hypothetical protein